MPDQRSHEAAAQGYAGMERTVLRRYVSGASTPEECRRVDAWASESAERRRYLSSLVGLYRRASLDDADSATTAWLPIAARMAASEKVGDVPFYVAPWERPAAQVDVRAPGRARVLGGAFGVQRREGWPMFVAAAAAVIFVIGGMKATLDTIATRNKPATPPPAAMRQIITAKGQRAEIQLDDGSKVTLGVASKLRLSSAFGVHSRDVYLDGTAYFDVVHDSTRPFVVHTGNAIARDVGTRFVVNAYPESHATQVIVRDGAVALRPIAPASSARQSSVLLTGGHLGRLRAGDATVTTRRVDPALYTAWMQGELVFRDVPLRDAVDELERWYDVDVQLGDTSLGGMPISASFAVESFNEAMSVITTVLPLRAVRHGNVVTLYRR